MFVEVKIVDEGLINWVAETEAKIFADAWSVDSIKDSLSYDYNKLVVLKDDNIVGYFISNNIAGTSELLRIAVDESLRSSGYGSKLLEKYFEVNDAEEYLLEVRATNEPAIGLYKKHGFVEIATRKNYYSNPTEDALILKRERIND